MVRGLHALGKITSSGLEFVAEAAQELLAFCDVVFGFDALGLQAVDDAEDAAALFGLGDDHLGGVGGGAEDATDFGHGLDDVEYVDREEAFARGRG